jgi:ribose transport system permease protein
MMNILKSVNEIILNGQYQIEMPRRVLLPFDTILFKILVLAGFFGLCIFAYHLTPIGRTAKFLGANPIAAKQTGISPRKTMTIAYLFTGLGVGLAAILTIIRSPVLNTSVAGSLGMDVLFAIVLGGMPVSGGARSRVTAALVGATSVVLLNQILLSFGLLTAGTQIAKAVLFIVVVFTTMFGYRTSYLPR